MKTDVLVKLQGRKTWPDSTSLYPRNQDPRVSRQPEPQQAWLPSELWLITLQHRQRNEEGLFKRHRVEWRAGIRKEAGRTP